MQVLPEAKDFIDYLEGTNPTYKWLVYIYSSNSYANFAPSVRRSPHRPPSDIYCWVGWHRYEQPRRCFRNPTLRTSGVCCWIIQESLWQVLHTTIAMVLCLNFNYQQLQSSYLFIILRPPPKKSGKTIVRFLVWDYLHHHNMKGEQIFPDLQALGQNGDSRVFRWTAKVPMVLTWFTESHGFGSLILRAVMG